MSTAPLSITSPWLDQLDRARPLVPVKRNTKTDLVIVGGGIAGVVTAYFLLKKTKQQVVLLEGDRIAHGATGHNAGQVVSYFERQFSDIVRQYGLSLAAKAQEGVNGAWDLLDEIYREATLQTPLSTFTGYAGLSSIEQVMVHLENRKLERDAGLRTESVLIADTCPTLKTLEAMYGGLFAIVPREQVLETLETEDGRYIAAVASKKGCLNSAVFTEELVGYLLAAYPRRFSVHEDSTVSRVVLDQDRAHCFVGEYEIESTKVILCTNGFEHLEIRNNAGADIDASFHAMVEGTVGYMAGYLAPEGLSPKAISYFPESSADPSSAYFYFTRRAYDHKTHGKHNLICIGGPEKHLEDRTRYERPNHAYPQNAQKDIDRFITGTYTHAPHESINYIFRWHGLMGYTPNGLRVIGAEPKNPLLLYNLGCNGVGILPSIYGGKRIADFVKHKTLEPSVFDPA